MDDRLSRKLAAILYADMAGYSRLTGEDEEGTHRALSDHLDVISAAIEQHQGRVVHYAGDAVIADFGTVTEALTSATAIQRELAGRNRALSEERRLQFRIGVNLGEVIVERNDIYGDGVNVAARLESLADRRRLADEALQIDPHYGHAWVAIGWTHWVDAYWGWGESSEVSLERAMEAGQKALDIDETDPDTFALLGTVHLFRGEHAKAVRMAEKGASLAPSHADAQALWAYTLNGSNKPKDTIQPIKRAIRLCPIYQAWYLLVLADSYRLMGNQGLVVSTLNEAIEHEPDSALASVWLANALADAELLDEAKAAAQRVLSIDPTFTLTRGAAGICIYKDPALNEKALENLRKAGLPG